jgi:hypothetical protein
MPNWVPLSQIVSVPAPSIGIQQPSFGPGFGIPQTSGLSPTGPTPPSLHWAVVMVLGLFTLGLFTIIWILVQAAFVAKLERRSGPVILAILAIISWGFQIYFSFGSMVAIARGEVPASGSLLLIELMTGVLLLIWAFYVRGILLQYYNSVEPISLRLSGVMTFFFTIFYFQHHFSRIAAGKRTGQLRPQ